MSQFFKFMFASCLGTALALILLLFIGFSTLAGFASRASEKPVVAIKPNSVLELKFPSMMVPEKTNNLPLDPFDLEQNDVKGVQISFEKTEDGRRVSRIFNMHQP